MVPATAAPMIVGPAKFDEGSTTMAEAKRMTVEEVVRDVLSDEHADVVREALRWLVRR